MRLARPSPLQNRVDPFGRLLAVPERGGWTGNRGCLHDGAYRIGRRGWTTRAWITCRLSFKNRRRAVMSPGRYTELFFLDEASAFAAGHRPCGECRRADFGRFKAAWLAGNAVIDPGRDPPITLVDAILHRERIARTPWSQAPARFAMIRQLPDGAMVSEDGGAWLLWRGSLHRWTPGGYVGRRQANAAAAMPVITPMSVVGAFAAGYRPTVHPTAEQAPLNEWGVSASEAGTER